jgi:adenylate cyclase
VADPRREAPAFVVVSPGTSGERRVPVPGRIFVGRQCAGVAPDACIIIDDFSISRTHLEIRLDDDRNMAFLIDTSTNGTYLNGSRVGRALPTQIKAGDRITVGETQLVFESNGYSGGNVADLQSTRSAITQSPMMMVVGDITNYSTISQVTPSEVIATSLQALWAELGVVLTERRGTLSNYAGDALYAIWELKHIPDANELAVEFALAANERVNAVAHLLPLRGPDGAPVRMGWGVVRGPGTLIALPGSAVSVLGDATNLAFRLSGIAGREGRAPVFVTSSAREAVVEQFQWGEPQQVPTKGRSGEETVYPVWGRKPQGGTTAPTASSMPYRG